MNFKIVSFQISKPDSLRVINQGWLLMGYPDGPKTVKTQNFPKNSHPEANSG